MISKKEKGARLLALVEEFIREQKISAPETICQSDRVIENAYQFIEHLCDVAGYYEENDENP